MNNTKLLINLVIDSSASMKGIKVEKIKKSLLQFDSSIKSSSLNDKIEYSITICKGLDAVVIKNFKDELNIDLFYEGGLPFVNKLLTNSINNLINSINDYENNNINLYKPWTILLINGDNYEDMDSAYDLFLKTLKQGLMSYFPFALTDCEFSETLSNIRHIKSFTVIKNEMYESLFDWILMLAKKRVNTLKEETVSIDATMFEGWTIK